MSGNYLFIGIFLCLLTDLLTNIVPLKPSDGDAALFNLRPKGKLCIPLDLTTARGTEVARKLIIEADVVVECLRPGNMEKYGLGPEEMMKENTKLIFARFTGYGHSGPYSSRFGHDGNFAALSGVLPLLGGGVDQDIENYPSYILTFNAGAKLCAFGILAAVYSGKGQVLELSTTEAMAYSALPVALLKKNPVLWRDDKRLFSMNIYKTRDNKRMTVSFIEERFFPVFRKALGMETDPEFILATDNNTLAKKTKEAFAQKTRDEWTEIFFDLNVCVTPVLDVKEAADDVHNKFRGAFSQIGDEVIANPSPRLSKTPAICSELGPEVDLRTQVQRALELVNFNEAEVDEMIESGVIDLKTYQRAHVGVTYM